MFAKIFTSIYDGSLGTRGPWEALITFQQMLILADRFGDVDMTAEVIAKRTLIPIEIINKGIEHLAKPDPESRNPKEDGRRIVPISQTRAWGWHIVNYTSYAAIRSAEERREYKAAYYREKIAPKRNADGAWWKSREGIEAKGAELSIPPQRGEEMSDYKDRLFAAINAAKAPKFADPA